MQKLRATVRHLRTNESSRLRALTRAEGKHWDLSAGASAPWGAGSRYALSLEPQVVAEVWTGTGTLAEHPAGRTLYNSRQRKFIIFWTAGWGSLNRWQMELCS